MLSVLQTRKVTRTAVYVDRDGSCGAMGFARRLHHKVTSLMQRLVGGSYIRRTG